jgi:hypothetical protein
MAAYLVNHGGWAPAGRYAWRGGMGGRSVAERILREISDHAWAGAALLGDHDEAKRSVDVALAQNAHLGF